MLDRELAQERLDALAKLGEENMRQILKGLSSAERWEFVEVVEETMKAAGDFSLVRACWLRQLQNNRLAWMEEGVRALFQLQREVLGRAA